MNFARLTVILIIVSFASELNANHNDPKAEKGVLDLRSIENTNHFIINLSGEWEFYWKRILRPYDFESTSFTPDYYGKVPSYWTDYPQDSVHTEKFGYATYKLTILLPSDLIVPLAIDLPVFDSSYDIYIDGKYLGGNGSTGKSADDSAPEYARNFFRLNPASDTMSIIINVSNFFHRRGGFWVPAELGTFHELQQKLAISWAANWSVISLLLGFSLFFMFFFIISPREKVMGFFSIVSLGLALRPLVTSYFLIQNIWEIEWAWIVRFEYIGLFIIITGSAWFIHNLYPTSIAKYFTWVITVIFILAGLLTLFLPVKVFSYSMVIYYPLMITILLYVLIKSFQGAIKKNILDIIYFLTFVLLLFGVIHDILIAMGRSDSHTGYILTYIIVLFVFILAATMLYKWVNAFREKEKLRNELEFMNRNLEKLVEERTLELQTINHEKEIQNNQIALQNKKLSDTLLIKDRIFSVIAHDLRSPVVNILYMLNMLKEKENYENYETFVNSSIQYSQLVISLLENMLVWGRGQEDKINYSPEKRDLSEIILTNLSIFKETADKKDISLNFTQVGNSMALIDKDLLDIIIRNLLSNAVKYTPRGGRISILLKDKRVNKEGLILKICDNGTGISEKKQKTLFTSKEIISTPGTEKEPGTGLGLKLSYELVKIHNGTITIESREGEGTCFTISLP